MPLMPPIPLLAPKHLHSLPALQCTPDTPYTPDSPLTPPILQCLWCCLYPCWPLRTYTHCQPCNAPLTPPTPPDGPNTPTPATISPMPPWYPDSHGGFQLSSLCNWSSSWVHLVYNIPSCFQLSSLCNWLSLWVHPVYNIPSWGVKSTSAVLWSSANFCNISQNMHSKAPVASQHWKTNKVVWTWKDDWPPWRTSTYKRPFTQEGNYPVYPLE